MSAEMGGGNVRRGNCPGENMLHPLGRHFSGKRHSLIHKSEGVSDEQVNRVPACMAGVKAGCVHLCLVAGNTVTLCDPIWQVTSRSCEMVYH